MVGEPQFTARVSRRIDSLFAILQKALRIGEGACLLGCAGSGKEEHFRADGLRGKFAASDFRRGIPERGGFGFYHVADNEPLQFSEGLALKSSVCSANGWVLTHHEQALDLAICHVEPVTEMGVVTADAREPVKSPVVFLSGAISVIRLHETDEVLVKAGP